MKTHPGLPLLLAATLGATALAAPVVDEETLQIQSETVRYDPAEIRDSRSAEDLFFRIRQAADEVCRISSFPRGYEIWYQLDCETEAVRQAVDDVDLPALDEYVYGDAGETVIRRR